MFVFWCHTYQIMLPFFFANSWDKCLFFTGYSITNKSWWEKSLNYYAVHMV